MYILGYKTFLNFFINLGKSIQIVLTGSLKIMFRSRSVNDRLQNMQSRGRQEDQILAQRYVICQSVVRFGYFYLHLQAVRYEFNKDVIFSKLLEPKEPPEPIKVNQGPPGKVRRRGKKYSL